MVTLARAFAPVASGSVHRTPNPPTAVARKAARRPVRALSPGFSGAGGVRGFVGDAARGASAPARAAEGGDQLAFVLEPAVGLGPHPSSSTCSAIKAVSRRRMRDFAW